MLICLCLAWDCWLVCCYIYSAANYTINPHLSSTLKRYTTTEILNNKMPDKTKESYLYLINVREDVLWLRLSDSSQFYVDTSDNHQTSISLEFVIDSDDPVQTQKRNVLIYVSKYKRKGFLRNGKHLFSSPLLIYNWIHWL